MKHPPIIRDMPRILFGGDYNPEQWPEEVWHEDARLMRETGVNLVSVGIFSWAFLEPSEGAYDLAWLERVLDLLHDHGVGACLATATASPPAWFTRKYPQSRPMSADGVALDFGSRQQYCPNSPEYRSAADALTGEIVRRLGHHPAVKLWHLNNEVGCHVTECHCPRCDAAFVVWLRGKYGTLDALNHAWGTAFWSQRYGAWDEIRTPKRMPTQGNPGQHLDYRRFFSDSLANLVRAELAVIRAAGNTLPATTNGIGFHPACDCFSYTDELDVAAWDSYPDPLDPHGGAKYAAFGHDLNRSLKHGRPFMLMEQAAAQVNWRDVNRLKPAGMMRAQNIQAIARGADACMFFQWRASTAGAEKFHSAMLPHAGPDSRVHREIKALGKELENLARFTGQPLPAVTTLLFSWENLWALETTSRPLRLDYEATVRAAHGACWDMNLATDLAPPTRPLPSSCRLVIAPSCYLLSSESAAMLDRFVADGGVLVTTAFTAVTDENEHIHPEDMPHGLREVLGIAVEEWQPLVSSDDHEVRWLDGTTDKPALLAEIIHVSSAEILATFTGGLLEGMPAVTRQSHGRGTAFHVATLPDVKLWQRILAQAAASAGIDVPATTSPGVEAVVRGDSLFLINHNPHPGAATMCHQTPTPATIELSAWETRILPLA